MTETAETGKELMGIKEVAESTGLPASTIRYYDQQFGDYLNVERGAGRRRLFSPASVQRLLTIQKLLRDEGLSLRQVRQKLTGQPGPADPAAGADSGEMERLKQEVRALEKQVAELRQIQRRTMALVESLIKG